MAICTLGACGKTVSKTEAKSAEAEKVVEENDSTKQTEEVDDSPFVTQMELNDEAGDETVMLKDSIEETLQAVIKAYPEGKDILEGERELWEKYYEAVKKAYDDADKKIAEIRRKRDEAGTYFQLRPKPKKEE